jgi:hypothetical protein
VRVLRFIAFVVVGFFVLSIALLMVAQIGMTISAPRTEVSDRKPFVDFIGREYRVVGDVTALAWNDFPNKEKILTFSLMSPPLTQNRYVSYEKHLEPGQVLRIVRAWRSITIEGFRYTYDVALPRGGLSKGIPIEVETSSDGSLNSRVYQFVGR